MLRNYFYYDSFIVDETPTQPTSVFKLNLTWNISQFNALDWIYNSNKIDKCLYLPLIITQAQINVLWKLIGSCNTMLKQKQQLLLIELLLNFGMEFNKKKQKNNRISFKQYKKICSSFQGHFNIYFNNTRNKKFCYHIK